MTGTIDASPSRPRATALPRVLPVLATVVGPAVVLNLLTFVLARAADVDLAVQTPASDHVQAVAWTHVLAMSLGPALVGALLLRLTLRWAPSSWRALAWGGLAVGLASMPVWAVATPGTKVALSTMHALTAVLWWVAVRRELRREGGADR